MAEIETKCSYKMSTTYLFGVYLMTFSTAHNINVSLSLLFAGQMKEADALFCLHFVKYSAYRERLQTKVMELWFHDLY
jgi:hypothetical protein